MEEKYINVNKEKKKYKRKRNLMIGFNVNQEERNMILRRMEQSGISSIRAYILKMAVDGRVIHVELDSVKEMVRLLSNATNNINQIAKKANETGNMYACDVEILREHIEDIWVQTKEILQKLSKL